MSAEADQLVARLKSRSLDRFVTLCKMHLSFLLDLPGSSLEELLGSSSSSESASSDRLWGFGNFTRRKSIKELSKSFDDEPVFGAPLSMNVIERVLPLISFLEMEENVNQEGLFRKCGHLGRQKALREKVSRGNDLECDLRAGVFTAHDCANVLKLFLGEMQDPLLTERHYFAHCQVAEMRNKEKKLQTIQLLIHLLPDENFSLLRSVLRLLHAVAGAKQSLMMPETLGTLFAPHLLVPKKVSPSDLHRRNQTITRVVAFMIENAPLLFSLPETVMQDIRACLREVEMRDCPRRRCVSGSDHRAERKPSCHDVGMSVDHHEIKTSISFADRTASLQAAAETDTVRALGELYAHIANLPESSKKRKLLKQFNQASAVGTTPVDGSQKPRRTRSLTQSLKKLVGHTKKTSVDATPADTASTDVNMTSPSAPTELATKQFHTPVIKQHASRTGAMVQQPPLARLLKFDRQQPLSILPSNLKPNAKSTKNDVPFVLYHPRGGSTIRGHSWTNLTRRSSENASHQPPHDSPAHLPLQSSFTDGGSAYKVTSHASGHFLDECKADFVSPVKSSPTIRASPAFRKTFKESS